MSTHVLRPNGTITAPAGGVTGAGGVAHTALNDDSDATYVSSGADKVAGTYDMGTVTMATGSVTKTIAVEYRGRGVVDSTPMDAIIPAISAYVTAPATLGTTIALVQGSPVAWTGTQAEIDALQVTLSVGVEALVGRYMEAYIRLVVAVRPVANITYPTGTPAITTTNKPIFIWTHSAGSDGGSQSHFEVKVYTAAQYGAGGFDPDTSTPFYTSGITVGSATTHESGVLTNSTTYRVYVRTAQLTNGTAQWSAWDFEGFSISVTTADVSAITATPFGDGRILVAVDRSGSAWDFVEVQRSIDAGVAWSYVRGGEYVNPATTTLFSTGGANDFDINDWEVPNGTMVLYRARATRILSGLPITGAWVQTAAAVAWASPAVWLKAPDEPALNRTVEFRVVPSAEFTRRQGPIQVLNRVNPVVISDVLSGGAGTLTFQTDNDAEMRDLFALLRKPVLLLHPTPGWAIPAQYIAPGNVNQSPLSSRLVLPIRLFDVGYHQVDAPADPIAGSP